jgi:hypothetical protein
MTNLTLITSIILTAAASTAGTYYVVTQVDPANNPVANVAAQQSDQVASTTQQPNSKPINVASNQQPNKPIELNIRTEVVEKTQPRPRHVRVRDLKQPHYEIGVLPK